MELANHNAELEKETLLSLLGISKLPSRTLSDSGYGADEG